jgi:hypothetical protein
MTSALDCNSILRNAAQNLGLEIHSFCDDLNNKSQPRYFHANAKSTQGSTLWRLKAVNPNREDKAGTQECNRYNNRVHPILAKIPDLRDIVTIPAYFDIPRQYLESLSCSELIEGRQPELSDVDLVVDLLIRLYQHRRPILHQINQHRFRQRQLDQRRALMPRFIDTPRPNNDFNRPQYRDGRLVPSVTSLQGRNLLSREEARAVVLSFDQAMPEPIKVDSLGFVHGDFSFGNLKITAASIALIDFEHSHIGSGLLDLAHLYVNFVGAGQNDTALLLLNSYREKAANFKIPYSDNLFHALTLERVAGKLNSMKPATGEQWDRLKALLFTKI